MVARFFMMQAHYRSELDFSSEALIASEKGFLKLMNGIAELSNLNTSGESSDDVNAMIEALYNAMNDDFNTPVLIANLFEVVTFINRVKDGKATISSADLDLLKKEMSAMVFDVLGLLPIEAAGNSKLEAAMDIILELRKNARENKDWGTSDLIRDKLGEAGISVKDGKDGTSWSVN